MMLTCAIVDDEPLALDLLEAYVVKTPQLELRGKYASAVEAMEGLRKEPVELLFLDIQMPDLNGLEFSRMVDVSTRIVFTTAFSQYALDGYRVNALDYLLKPISYKDFLEAVEKAVEWFEMKSGKEAATASGNGCIYVKSDYKLVQIQLSRILYIEGLKDYVKFYIEGEPRPLLSQISMKSLEEKLPSGDFMRVHRSFIVQKSKITVVERGRIVFGREYVPVSDSYKAELQAYLNSRML